MSEDPQTKPRRGEVYTCRMPAGDQAETIKVVVISRDDWNANPPDGRIWVVPIKRKPRPLSFRLDDTDPVGGWVLTHAHAMIPSDWLAEQSGMLTGANMERIRKALAFLQDDIEPA